MRRVMALLLTLAAIFLIGCIAVCAYAMARPDQFFADAPAVRLAVALRQKQAAAGVNSPDGALR
jgi:hypothetical protein